MIVLSGAQLCRMLRFVFRDEVWEGAHCEFHQFSRGMRVFYGRAMRTFLEMSLDGEPIRDDRKYTVGIEQLHLVNLEENLAVSPEEITANRPPKLVAISP